MRDSSLSGWIRAGFTAIRRILRWRDSEPEDPYAMVTAPTRPGRPSRSARAAAQLER